jgi:DNA-binding transcriptional regulator YhcF (GntR family)
LDGWIKLHRCTLNKAIWKLPDAQRIVFLTILMLANHEENSWVWQGEKFTCAPGQFITSIDSLSKAAKVSPKSVRTSLVNLEKLDFLANKSAKTGRLITVNNWALYQSQDETSAKEAADERQSIGKASATNKNDKNDKNKDILPNGNISKELAETFDAFVKMRKAIKKPMTDRAIPMMLNKLHKLARTDAEKIAILEQSIMNSWTNIYHLKQDCRQQNKMPRGFASLMEDDVIDI